MCYIEIQRREKLIVPRWSCRWTSWKRGMGAGGAQGKSHTKLTTREAQVTTHTTELWGRRLCCWVLASSLLGTCLSPRGWLVCQECTGGRMFSPFSCQRRGKNWGLNHNREQPPLFFPPSSYSPSGTATLSLSSGWELLAQADSQEVGTGSQCHQCRDMRIVDCVEGCISTHTGPQLGPCKQLNNLPNCSRSSYK